MQRATLAQQPPQTLTEQPAHETTAPAPVRTNAEAQSPESERPPQTPDGPIRGKRERRAVRKRITAPQAHAHLQAHVSAHTLNDVAQQRAIVTLARLGLPERNEDRLPEEFKVPAMRKPSMQTRIARDDLPEEDSERLEPTSNRMRSVLRSRIDRDLDEPNDLHNAFPDSNGHGPRSGGGREPLPEPAIEELSLTTSSTHTLELASKGSLTL